MAAVARKKLEIDLRDGSGRVVKFDVPMNATPAQITTLAARAIKQAHPDKAFQRPRLTREVADQSKIFDASVSATPNSLRARAGNKARDIATGVGFSKQTANNIASRTEGAIDYVPLAGDAVGADDALSAFKAGRYGEAALGAGATAVGLIPGFGDAAAGVGKAMFLGAKAKTADKAKLALAEKLAASGADRQEIWDQTGWFQGADKQWRFEVDDRSLKVKDPPTAKQAGSRAADAKAKELGWKNAKDARWTGDRGEVRSAEIGGWNATVNGLPADDFIQHNELEDAYGLGDLKVSADVRKGLRGSYSPETGTIRWKTSGRPAAEKRSTVAHELQHHVQAKEGFSRGSLVGEAPAREGGVHYSSAVITRDKVLGMINDPNISDVSKIQLRRMLPQYEKQVEEAAQFEGYQRVAGEVEARNVQARLLMTPEERAANPPWTTQSHDEEDQFVIWGGDGQAADAEDPLEANWTRAYHGTRSEFDEFGRIDDGNANGKGYYFTTDPETASRYATGEDVNRISLEGNAGPNVRPVDLQFRDPFDGNKPADRALMKRLADAQNKIRPGTWAEGEIFKHMDRPGKARDVLQFLTYNADEQSEILRAAGFDARLGGYGENDIMVFDPAQIRSPFARPADDIQADMAAPDLSLPDDPIGAKWEVGDDLAPDDDPIGAKWGLEGADSPLMISTRRPTAPNYDKFGNPDKELLIQSGDALKLTPKAFDKNMGQLAEEPFMSGVTGSSDDIYREGVNRGAENLEFIVNDLMDPAQVDATRGWYETAHNMAGRAATNANYPVEAGYGVAAVTSPQKAWDINVANTERLFQMTKDGWQSSPDEVKAGLKWVDDRITGGVPGAVAGRGPEYAARILASPMEALDDKFDRYAA